MWYHERSANANLHEKEAYEIFAKCFEDVEEND